MSGRRSAAIVTIGTELVEGLRVDTNTALVAREISPFGFGVQITVSVGDDPSQLQDTLASLVEAHELVVVTGGLGPTHDDVTREAAAAALGISMRPDDALIAFLEPFVARHKDAASGAQVLTQALVLDGAEIIQPTSGTAPGQVVPTARGTLVLLPGPPSELRPMLQRFLTRYAPVRALPREIGVTGMPESDVQHVAQRALAPFPGVQLTILARPGDVRVILLDDGAGDEALGTAASAVARELGVACYSSDGSTLAEVVIAQARARDVTIGVAESCTGGMIAAALTDVAGASEAFLGGATTYSNASKTRILGVSERDLAAFGAVSSVVARAMAQGALELFDADVAVSVTGIAGPSGGSADKPVGTVWFGLASHLGQGIDEQSHVAWTGSTRDAIRARATSKALDILRREILLT